MTRIEDETLTIPTDEFKLPEEKPEVPLTINLVKNPLLRKVVNKVRTQIPDWDAIARKLKIKAVSPANDAGNFHGAFAETHLKMVLSALARKSHGRVLDSVPYGARSKHFGFKWEHSGSLVAFDLRTRRKYAEYDALTEIDGLPVVWETKIYLSHGRSNEKFTLSHALKNERINQLFTPLVEYYRRRDFGYVVVSARERFIPSVSDEQRDFLSRGGILIPFPVPTAELKAKASAAKSKYGL